MTWISLQPAAGAIENGYGYDSIAVSTLGVIYMVAFIVFVYPANCVIDMGGLRLAVVLGTGLTMLGMILKCLINLNFYWVYIGHTLAAIGKVLLAIAPAKVATFWFGPNEVS